MLVFPEDKEKQQRVSDIFKEACNNGSGMQLLELFMYFHTYGDDGTGRTMRVYLHPAANEAYFDITWKRVSLGYLDRTTATGTYRLETSMVGGLVYRKDPDDQGKHWSVHT